MRRILACLLFAAASPAALALEVFACTPEWGALARELGGEKATVYTATTALQDAHRVEARPSLVARARRAQLVLCTGAGLEEAWLPLVLSQSGNPAVRPGQPGYFEAAGVVPLIEKPSSLDRAQGDVHAAGNPHLHLDPRNVAAVAAALARRMAQVDPGEAAYYQGRERQFLGRWQDAIQRWERQAAPLKGMPIVVYHRDLSYLVGWLGLREVASLEPKPGLPPSGAHLAQLLERLKSSPAKAVVRSAYADPRAAEWLAERSHVPVVVLPYTVGGTEAARDLFGLFEDTIARLLAAGR